MSVIKRYQAPSGANYYDNIGCVVNLSDASAKEVTLETNGTSRLFGIITDAENATAGWVNVCVSGECKGRAGAAITEANPYLTAGADGRLDPAGSGEWVIALAVITADAADGDWIDVIVERSQLN
jgi:hypothetical protein